MDQKYTFEQFCGIIRELRGENGCPWDKVQTHESLIPCMIEEAYEAVDGIKTLQEGKGWDSLCEELGDVLMQVIFHSQLAEEEGYFTFEDVVDGISRKMIHRHPHVFGGHTEEKPEDAGGGNCRSSPGAAGIDSVIQSIEKDGQVLRIRKRCG